MTQLPLPGVHADSRVVFAPAPASAGTHDGSRLTVRDPERYQQVIDLHGDGLGALLIASRLSMSVHTVLAVLERERARAQDPVAIDNTQVIRSMRQARRLMVEGILEDVSDPDRRAAIPTQGKAITAAILTDKIELLEGNATARVELVHGADPASLNEYLDALPQVHEITDQGVATGKQKEAVVEVAVEPGPRLLDAGARGTPDVVSGVSVPVCVDPPRGDGSPRGDSGRPTEGVEGAGPGREVGGEGVARAARGQD